MYRRSYPLIKYDVRQSYFNWVSRRGQSGSAAIAAQPPLRLKNSSHRAYEKLQLSQPPIVRWYACGPTVYDSAHLGHAYSYVQFDLIRRALEEFYGLNVVQVMNITDIDDKIIAKASQTKTAWTEVSRKYENEFREDMLALGVQPPAVTARITEFMPQTVQFIQRLIDAGQAYSTPTGDVYFDVQKYAPYGIFQKLAEPEKSDDTEKRSSADFALWKAAKPDEPSWPGPASAAAGRPGWHVECSTVASHFFGSSVDLHSGGVDLKFPHHENEEAQCCAYHRVKEWAGLWLHSGHMIARDLRKMSKSESNFISIRDYLEKHTAQQFRMLCMKNHYRQHCIYDEEQIRVATETISKFTRFSNTVSDYLSGTLPLDSVSISELVILSKLQATQNEVLAALSDDFDFGSALRSLSELVATCHQQLAPVTFRPVTSATPYSALAAASHYIDMFFRKCGLILPTRRNIEVKTEGDEGKNLLPAVMAPVLEFRSTVRQAALASRNDAPDLSHRVLTACDGLRVNLGAVGVNVKDLGGKSTWELQIVPEKAGKRLTGTKA